VLSCFKSVHLFAANRELDCFTLVHLAPEISCYLVAVPIIDKSVTMLLAYSANWSDCPSLGSKAEL